MIASKPAVYLDIELCTTESAHLAELLWQLGIVNAKLAEQQLVLEGGVSTLANTIQPASSSGLRASASHGSVECYLSTIGYQVTVSMQECRQTIQHSSPVLSPMPCKAANRPPTRDH
jgi:hypothetical protein